MGLSGVQVVALLAVLACAAEAQVSEEPYTGNKYARRFNTGGLLGDDGNYDEGYPMRTGLLLIPFAVVAFFVLYFFCCWSCCRLGGIGKGKKEMPKHWEYFWNFLLFGCVVGLLVVLIYGFRADDTQQDALQSVPALLDNVVQWKNDTADFIDDITGVINRFLTDLNQLALEDNTFFDESLVAPITDALNSIISETEGVSDIVRDLDIESTRDDLSEQVTDADDKRHLALVIILSVILIIVLFQIAVTLGNAYLPKKLQPRTWCCALPPIITFLMIVIMFMMWIVVLILYLLTALTADYCTQPDDIVLSLVNSDPNTTATYFFVCDEVSRQLENPLTSEITTLKEDADDEVQVFVTDLKASVPPCAGVAACEAVEDLIDQILLLNNELQAAVGDDFDGDGNFDTGLLSQLNCETMNGKYQAVVNVMCNEMLPSVAVMFETFLAFGIVAFFAEIVRRRMDRINEPEKPSKVMGNRHAQQDGIDGFSGNPIAFNGAPQPMVQVTSGNGVVLANDSYSTDPGGSLGYATSPGAPLVNESYGDAAIPVYEDADRPPTYETVLDETTAVKGADNYA